MKEKMLRYIEKFMCKYFKTEVLEDIVLVLLGNLVRKTSSKIDDEIFAIVFSKIYEESDEK